MHADGRSLDGTIVEILVKLLVIALLYSYSTLQSSDSGGHAI